MGREPEESNLQEEKTFFRLFLKKCLSFCQFLDEIGKK